MTPSERREYYGLLNDALVPMRVLRKWRRIRHHHQNTGLERAIEQLEFRVRDAEEEMERDGKAEVIPST